MELPERFTRAPRVWVFESTIYLCETECSRGMHIINQVLTDCLVIKPDIFRDGRGYFCETYNSKKFRETTGCDTLFVQDNQSLSSKGTLRGLHFQTGAAAQSKLVRVVHGRVFDVAVDLRPESRTFAQWHGLELSAENKLQFYIPRGFAHGF